MGAILEINERSKMGMNDALAPLSGMKYRWNWGLLISLGSGLLAAVVGLSFSSVSWFALPDVGNKASIIGAFLLLAAFILFFLAAHFMDKVDKTRKAIRREIVRRAIFERNAAFVSHARNGGSHQYF